MKTNTDNLKTMQACHAKMKCSERDLDFPIIWGLPFKTFLLPQLIPDRNNLEC
jgi:hypothetical protein